MYCDARTDVLSRTHIHADPHIEKNVYDNNKIVTDSSRGAKMLHSII